MRRSFLVALFALASFLAVFQQACTFRAEPTVQELAEQGDARSQFRLAKEYMTGMERMEKDAAKSYYWFLRALKTGLPGDLEMMARQSMQELEATAPAAEIEMGRKMLEEEEKKGK